MSRVLLAVPRWVREEFFPGLDLALPVPLEWQDTAELSPEDWPRVLENKRPAALVTGWETPPLPAPELLPELPAYVCHLAGTVRGLVPRAWLERGVLVSNWGNTVSHTIAEHAVLLILGSLRNMPLWKCFMDGETGGDAKTVLQTRSLRGRRVGIHGFGTIARELAALLKAFGVSLSAWSEGVPEALFREHGAHRCADLRELFSTSDVLVELEALTERSRGSVNRELLELLPSGAVFVNVGRGAVVDEEALAALAAEGRIRVALDVFQREPLPPDSPLRDVDAALLSPHIAGPTRDAFPLCGAFALENLRRYFASQPVEGRVTLEIYDRTT